MALPKDLREIATQLDEQVEEMGKLMENQAIKSQDSVYKRLSELLKGLKTDKDGSIKNVKENIRIISQINKEIKQALSASGYFEGLGNYKDGFADISALNNAYYATMLKGVEATPAAAEALKELLIDETLTLIGDTAINETLIQPVRQIVIEHVTGKATFGDLQKRLREYLLETDTEGALQRYVKQTVYDATQQYTRIEANAYSQDLGLEWFLYEGGKIDTTRPFCVQRANKFYHISEIRKWNYNSDWQGKIPGTNSSNIFFYCGGYNCRHTLRAVSDIIVPEADKERVK